MNEILILGVVPKYLKLSILSK